MQWFAMIHALQGAGWAGDNVGFVGAGTGNDRDLGVLVEPFISGHFGEF